MDIENILELISGNLFNLFCHQDPSILLQINGKSILLCPRCSGLHIGFFISLIFFSFEKIPRSKLVGAITLIFSVIGIVLMALEWFLAQLGVFTPTLTSRLLTGLIAGTSINILALLYHRNYSAPVINPKSFTVLSIIGVTATSVIVGFILFQIKSWTFITFMLIVVFLVNLSFILYSILLRFISLKITKT